MSLGKTDLKYTLGEYKIWKSIQDSLKPERELVLFGEEREEVTIVKGSSNDVVDLVDEVMDLFADDSDIEEKDHIPSKISHETTGFLYKCSGGDCIKTWRVNLAAGSKPPKECGECGDSVSLVNG